MQFTKSIKKKEEVKKKSNLTKYLADDDSESGSNSSGDNE